MPARRRSMRRTARRTSRRVSRRQGATAPPPQEYAAPPPQQVAQAPAPAPASAPEPEADLYEQLEKLGKLHADGILTEEEFAEQKAKILNG